MSPTAKAANRSTLNHYRFRYVTQDAEPAQPLTLTIDQSWTDNYFAPDSLPCRDRLYFTGEKVKSIAVLLADDNLRSPFFGNLRIRPPIVWV